MLSLLLISFHIYINARPIIDSGEDDTTALVPQKMSAKIDQKVIVPAGDFTIHNSFI